jgi:hypothetical protein
MKIFVSAYTTQIFLKNFILKYKILEYLRKNTLYKKYTNILAKFTLLNFTYYQKKFYLKFLILIKKIGKIFLDRRLYPILTENFNFFARKIHLKCNIEIKKSSLVKNFYYRKKLSFFSKTIKTLVFCIELTKKNLIFFKKILFEIIFLELLKITKEGEKNSGILGIGGIKNSVNSQLNFFYLDLKNFFFSNFKIKKKEFYSNERIKKKSYPVKPKISKIDEEKKYILFKNKNAFLENFEEVFVVKNLEKKNKIFFKTTQIQKKHICLAEKLLYFLFCFKKNMKSFDLMIQNLIFYKNKIKKEKKKLRIFFSLLIKKIFNQRFFGEKRNEKTIRTKRLRKGHKNLRHEQTQKKVAKYQFQNKFKEIFNKNSYISFSRMKEGDLQNKISFYNFKKVKTFIIKKKFSKKDFKKEFYFNKKYLFLKKICVNIFKKNIFLKRKIGINQKKSILLQEKLHEIRSMEIDQNFMNKNE